MELEDDDFDAYELDATGMIIKSPGNGDPAAAPREVRVHRSGSIDISAAAGYGRSNNRDNRNNTVNHNNRCHTGKHQHMHPSTDRPTGESRRQSTHKLATHDNSSTNNQT